jgi:hypothetical protein
MRALTFAAALLVTTLGHNAWAQSAAEHQERQSDRGEGQPKSTAEQQTAELSAHAARRNDWREDAHNSRLGARDSMASLQGRK